MPSRCSAALHLLVLTGVLVTAAACKPSSQTVDNVILISIDSLRHDHLGSYGYPKPTSPTIDGLAKDGIRFDRAYSTTSWTLPSHAAMLTGQFNETHGAIDSDRQITKGIPTLAEALARSGIHTAGIYSGPYLDPTFGFERGFASYASAMSYTWQGVGSAEHAPHVASHKDVTNPRIEERVREWLSATAADDKHFLFIHMWDVHYDYHAPRDYVALFDPDYQGHLDTSNFPNNPNIHPGMAKRDFQHLLAQYDAEIRYTDDTIRGILRLLEDAGRLESAAVIVTADHGEEFFDHGGKGHMWTLHEEVLRVPLVLKLFGAPPISADAERLVSHVDIFPTVCGLLGVDCAYSGPGLSLLSPPAAGTPPSDRAGVLAQLTSAFLGIDQRAIVRRGDKLVHQRKAGHYQYYDLAQDRAGRNAITLETVAAEAAPAKAVTALADMERLLAEAEATRETLTGGQSNEGAPQISEGLQQRLRALGYIE